MMPTTEQVRTYPKGQLEQLEALDAALAAFERAPTKRLQVAIVQSLQWLTPDEVSGLVEFIRREAYQRELIRATDRGERFDVSLEDFRL